MIREGSRDVTPRPVEEPLMRVDLEMLAAWAKKLNAWRDYAGRKDVWGRGFVDNPALIGKVGEFAAAQHLSRKLGIQVQVDYDYRPRGDGGIDLIVLGKGIQVKTRGRSYGEQLVRRCTEAGTIVPIEWDILLGATWEAADPFVCRLDGYINRQDFLDYSDYVQGRRGDWKNLSVPDCKLDSMKHMIEKFELLLPGKGSV